MRKFIFPVRAAFIRKIHRSFGYSCQLSGSTQKIGVDMRFSNMGYLKLVLRSNIEIDVNIALSINNHRFAGLLASDYITALSQTLVINVLKKHISIIFIFLFLKNN